MPKPAVHRPPIAVVVEFDPEEMARRGRLGALALHARHDSNAIATRAREAFLSRFEREVDPAGVLPPAERARRAERAKRLHFTRLAHKSADARRAMKGARTQPGAAVAVPA